MSTGGLFSFNPAAGETPETLKRRRQVAEAMLANAVGQPASTIGGGLADLGQAIGGRLALGRVNRAEAAGQAGAADVFSKIFSGGGAAAPGETAAVPGTEPVSGVPPTAGSVALAGANTGIPDVARMEAEIRRVAPKYGIDPDIAVKVARSEGLAPGVWQSNVTGSGGRETSYGPFQLLAGGGLGDEFQRTTGLDLRDPKTWQAQIDFALGQAAKQGWTPWHGAAKVGVGPRTGIGGGTPAVTAALAGTEPVASADPAALAAAGMGGGNFDFSRYATGGAAARPDSFSGLKPAMASGLEAMISSAPPDIQRELRVTSGYRSPETQKVLFDRAVKKYGSVSAARHNVAPPGRSQHGFGNAIDWKFASKRAREWVHANAGKYGFTFPLGHEPWHMEVAGARGPSGGPAVSQNASGRGRPIDSTSGSIFALAGGGGQPAATRAQMSGGLPAVMEALTGAAPQQQAISGTGAGPDVRAMLAGGGYIDPAAKDDMLSENIPDTAFRPAGGPTPYSAGATVLGGNSANAGRLVPVPDPNRPPAVAPVAPVAPVASVAAPEAPPVAATAPAAPGVAPVAQALGYDPLPQTSAMPGVGGVQGAGHESLSPGAQAVSQALAGGGGTDTLAGGGGKGFFGRIFGGRTGTPPAVAGGGGAVPPTAATGAPGVGGSAGPEGAPGAAGGFSPRAQAAIAALQNPWLNEGQQAVAKTILDNEIAQADPKYRVELAKIRYDLAVSQAKDPIEIAKAKTELDRLLTPTKVLTPEETKAARLPPDAGTWQMDDDGNYKVIPGTEPSDPEYNDYVKEALAAREAAKAAGVAEVDLPPPPVDRLAWRKGGAASVSVNTAETAEAAFSKKFGEKGAENFFERRDTALDAALSLEANNEARALLDQGVITGFGADWITSFDQAIKQLGFNEADDASVNTQAYVATRAQEVGRIIKMFGAGTGLSDADREYARQAAAGDITLDERAIRKVLDINDRAVRNVIKRFNADASRIDPKISPFPLTIDMPPAYVPPKSAGKKTTITPADIPPDLEAGKSVTLPDGTVIERIE